MMDAQQKAIDFLFGDKPKDYLFTTEDRKRIAELAWKIKNLKQTRH